LVEVNIENETTTDLISSETSEDIFGQYNSIGQFSINPHNQKITYCHRTPNDTPSATHIERDIYEFDLETQNIIPIITESGSYECHPQWSPRGTYLSINYANSLPNNNTSPQLNNSIHGLRIYDKNFNLVTFLPNVAGDYQRYSWSPDEDAVLYVRGGRLYYVEFDNPDEHILLSTNVAYVAWSPDGQYVAYTSVGAPGTNAITIVETDVLLEGVRSE